MYELIRLGVVCKWRQQRWRSWLFQMQTIAGQGGVKDLAVSFYCLFHYSRMFADTLNGWCRSRNYFVFFNFYDSCNRIYMHGLSLIHMSGYYSTSYCTARPTSSVQC